MTATEKRSPLMTVCIVLNALLLLFVAIYFFLIPGVIVVRDVNDPALADGTPRAAWRLFRGLTPTYERWARARIASGRAAGRPVTDIAGTEWPVFGSAFYLWAVEELQAAWEKDHTLSPIEPKVYARGAVEAAKDLIIDRSSAGWVVKYWGDDYLHHEDVFYRMLIIAALTSHHKLTGETRHLAQLREQVETLASELDASPTGQLDDYPGQCYTTDVLAAVAMIRRADKVLGTDHSEFVKRSLRGFSGKCLDRLGLPPFQSDSKTGEILDPARGSSNSYACMFAPEIWPDAARTWYDLYEKHYWQRRWLVDGFREDPKDRTDREWWVNVDAGPVLAGHGISACAFGLAAARANGHAEHARPLAAEVIAMSWPLADGTLLLSRVLSNATDAPLVGEASILFSLTRPRMAPSSGRTADGMPGFVKLLVAAYFALALVFAVWSLLKLRKLRRIRTSPVPAAPVQFAVWLALVIGGVAAFVCWSALAGCILIFIALFFPLERSKRRPAKADASTPS